ncbi:MULTISPECIES: hypothetical protein [Kribbella]|uniref:DUF222 domain-containing protein n=1 Tax=Kribbella karoonensis TaxID=324851 RepID=A0ABP4Q3U2_9ACTN
MSGSTGFEYRVVSAEELRRRAIEAATARVIARQTAVRVLRASVEKTVAAGVPATRTGRLTGLALERLTELEGALAAEEEAIGAATVQARAERARQTLASEIEALQVALPSIRFRSTTPARRPSVRTEPSERLARRVEAVLELALGLDDSVRADVQKLAAVVTDSDSGPARAMSFLTEMEAKVTQAVRRQRAEERRRRRAHELTYEYAVLLADDGEAGRRARAAVARLDGTDPDATARELRELDARRAQAADRRFVLDQATAVLHDMGYVVDVEPTDGTTVAVAADPDWPHHGLKVVFPSDAGGMHTIPVAFDETDVRDDLAFEESSCDVVDRLRVGLDGRGVPTDLTYRRTPGELPVQHQTRRTAVGRTETKVRRRQR